MKGEPRSDIVRPSSLAEMGAVIDRAAALIRAGDLVAIPTETVYGLAADATNDKAVARIFEAKGRPSFNPLIVHVLDAAMARDHVEFSLIAEKLATAFWPGPLTLVLPRNKKTGVSLLASAGLDTLAVRAPDHGVPRALIEACGRPLAAPSANRSGSVSPTTAEHVRESLGDRVKLIIDGGPCRIGVESTIVAVDGESIRLLRPGGVPRGDIERILGAPLEAERSAAVEAPGMMESHYAPEARLRPNATAPEPREAFLGFGAVAPDGPATLNLSARGDIVEAAANLFAHLRALDTMCAKEGLIGIAAATIPNEGLGEAINDRLLRASRPRL